MGWDNPWAPALCSPRADNWLVDTGDDKAQSQGLSHFGQVSGGGALSPSGLGCVPGLLPWDPVFGGLPRSSHRGAGSQRAQPVRVPGLGLGGREPQGARQVP